MKGMKSLDGTTPALRSTAWTLCALAALAATACGKKTEAPTAADAAPAAEEKVLNVYNWSDYIAEDTVPNFEAQTGIKVTYDVFDSNEVLEAKLMSGNTGYDVVVPSLSFLGRQIQAGVFAPLDKAKLPNYKNLDATLLARIAEQDPGNTYAVPYLWGTTGIGYNVEKVHAALGADAPLDTWAMVLDPANAEKLKACGVTMLDTPSEIIPIVLNYLGEDPNSFDEAVIAKAEAVLATLRPSITYFHSSQYINDLANGDICVAIGWSGDIFQAAARAEEAGNGVKIEYVIPKEGAPMWFDMLAIPKDAQHPQNALAFINYLLDPAVIAGASNYVAYANGNAAALPMLDAGVRDNPAIYPPADVMAKLFTFKVLPPEVDRLYNRAWTTLKTGK